MVDGVIDVYFADAVQPIKFVTADELDPEFDKVLIRVGTDLSGYSRPIGSGIGEEKTLTEKQKQIKTQFEKLITQKKAEAEEKEGNIPPIEAPIIAVCYNDDYIYEENYWEGFFKTKNEVIEIMLGESKYFQAKKNTTTGELKIEEIEADENGVPQRQTGTVNGWEWLTSDVWVDNPVMVDSCDNCAKKMGVYWEKEKPIWDVNTNRGNLATGLIRTIGRFWHIDSTYIVDLKAKTSIGDSTSIKIKVIKPSELKSDNQSDSYSKTIEVQDSVVNIDSLCIYFGGINGIPPQFIKGHIYSEAAKTDFSGEIGKGFAPSYRYEPFTTQNKRAVLENMKNNPFYITSTTNVNPPNHNHVKIIPYFTGDTITVWQIVAEHSQLVRDGSTEETRMYGVRTTKDTMNYGKYKTMQRQYHSFFAVTEKTEIINPDRTTRKMTFAERADSTNKRMIVYLRDEFEFDDLSHTKGMKNMIAQTRIASSYGYFQALYTTVINPNDNWLYPENADNPPENLNKNYVLFPMATRMHRKYLENGLGNQASNNWTLGFEAALKQYILKKWNTDEDYPNEVYNNVIRFLPKK
jgi:hypothetical protein